VYLSLSNILLVITLHVSNFIKTLDISGVSVTVEYQMGGNILKDFEVYNIRQNT